MFCFVKSIVSCVKWLQCVVFTKKKVTAMKNLLFILYAMQQKDYHIGAVVTKKKKIVTV